MLKGCSIREAENRCCRPKGIVPLLTGSGMASSVKSPQLEHPIVAGEDSHGCKGLLKGFVGMEDRDSDGGF